MIFSTPVTVKDMKKNLNIMQPYNYSKQILPVAWPWPFVILWFHRTTSVINQKKFTFENCSITEPIFLS